MARLRRSQADAVALAFTFLLTIFLSIPTGGLAAEQALYDQPVLTIDPDMHTGLLSSSSVDAAGHFAVTGSFDKTVRIWSISDGKLVRTIEVPAGPDNIGKIYAVAISPNGDVVAAGGWTGPEGQEFPIYLFNVSTGEMVKRISGSSNVVYRLVFSPNGRYLAATLGRPTYDTGLRVYDREKNWSERFRDERYFSETYGAAFADDGRLVTASYDGMVRLYDADFKLFKAERAKSGERPRGVAFSPDGKLLALGYDDVPSVDLLEASTLSQLPSPATDDLKSGQLEQVAWSSSGKTLFATGEIDRPVLFAWDDGGQGKRHALPCDSRAAVGLHALATGHVLISSLGPDLTLLDSSGNVTWARHRPGADMRNQARSLKASKDGAIVEFGFEASGKSPLRFDVGRLRLDSKWPADDLTREAKTDGLSVAFDEKIFHLRPREIVRTYAIQPDLKRFVLGTGYGLVAFDVNRGKLWLRSTPDEVWAANITGDGRIVVAGLQDGTICWYRMDDGGELLALMVLNDRQRWVAWTPEGFYAATVSTFGVLRWRVNRKPDEAAVTVPVENIPGSYKPEVLPLVLKELETPRALGLAAMAEHSRQVMLRTQSHIAAGARLHLLTIGIDNYNEEHAKNLRLKFARRDASDFMNAILYTQDALYRIKTAVLLDKDATKAEILRVLKNMRASMDSGNGNDLAVIHFSGHGALVDHKLYLLPYDVDLRDDAGIEFNGLSAEELRSELMELGQRGRVLVLLDACHSGATTTTGGSLSMDSTGLRNALAGANVSVLTSSSGTEVSFEEPKLEHGAFTQALLEAFNNSDADINGNGLITPSGLANFVANCVPQLTDDKQHPGMEVRYNTTLFARSPITPARP